LQGVFPADPAAAKIDQLVENSERGFVREFRQLGIACGDIDRRSCEDQLSDFDRKARCVDQGHPAALAQAKKIHATAQLIHQYVEIGEVIIDRQKAHVGTCRAPVRKENTPDAGVL